MSHAVILRNTVFSAECRFRGRTESPERTESQNHLANRKNGEPLSEWQHSSQHPRCAQRLADSKARTSTGAGKHRNGSH